ncbi:response regulator transcription factor [Cohnella silvisoli]|uniref:Response regulator n=1 Tax=Cohnella silvisoli TaxID=2873699 RepID=A0ABV1KXD0_9BACL|nr:response regulator [Cohnella silvisoli]MCD9023775.1 response regulator [Cohnella silvisoli]
MIHTRVMIVDDEVPIRESLRMFPWVQYGFDLVGEARHGEEALEISGRLKPAIVVTDIVMPIMDGLRLTRLLKERQPELQVILLTCHSEFDYAREALALGASDYLVKGAFRDQDLLEALNKAQERLPEQKPNEPDKRYEIRHALEYVDKHLSEPFDLGAMALHVGLSANYLGVLFRKETGASFQDYVKRKRLEKAAHLLRHSHLKVYEVASETGFPNYRYFTDVFCQQYGRSPREFRNGHG